MMKLKLKEALPTDLTKAPAVVIMNCNGAFGCESFLSEAPLRA